MDIKKKIRPNVFKEFKNEFSCDSMEKIRFVGFTQKDDSEFVLAVVRGLYEGKLDVLSKKSVTGRSKDGTKEAISPTKMSIVKNMFKKRIEMNSFNSVERKKKIARHIKTAIENINKIGH